MWPPVAANQLLLVVLPIILSILTTAGLASDVRVVNVTTLCTTPLLLQLTADLVDGSAGTNRSDSSGHIVYLFSTVGVPGILMAYAPGPLEVEADCIRLGLERSASARFIGEPLSMGTSLVFEAIVEFVPTGDVEDKVSFDGLNANEYDPSRDEVVKVTDLSTVQWKEPMIDYDGGNFTFVKLVSLDETIVIEVYNTGVQVDTLLGVLTPDAAKLRMEIRNFPFLQPERSRVAFQVTVSSEMGNQCPQFGYYTTPSDVTFSKLFTRLVAQIVPRLADPDGGEPPVLGYVGWPPLARLVDPGEAVLTKQPADYAINGLSDGAPTDAAPAVVNITRLDLDNSAQVSYLDAPFSIMKGVMSRPMVQCIRRAYVTVEAPVRAYMSWEPEIGSGAPALPGVPFAAYLTMFITSLVPAVLAVVLVIVASVHHYRCSSDLVSPNDF